VCLAGGFDALVDRPRRGVTAHQGVLTHGVTRQANVKVVLPYLQREASHLTQAIATLRAPAHDGNELVFALEASDVVTVKNQHSASLTISMLLPRSSEDSTTAPHDVRLHDKASASYRQSFDVALSKASLTDLNEYAGPFVKQLFHEELGGEFSTWLDDAFGDLPGLGNALLSLDVTLPPQACLAWTNAPADEASEVYQRLSLSLQAKYRQLLHDAFFHNVDRFDNVGFGSHAFAMLVFTSLFPATAVRMSGSRLEIAPRDFQSSAVHWNFDDARLLAAVAGSDRVKAMLKARLASVRRRLQAAGKQDLMQFYMDSQIDGPILGSALTRDPGKSLFRSLLFVEREMVTEVRAAALRMAAFKQHQDAARARRELAEFGAKVTEAFNARLGNVAVGAALRPLGGLMFITAAEVFNPSLTAAASAMLNITDVRDDVKFPPDRFPDHDPIAEADIVRSETLIHAPG
jgi:hypothetical protein